eukprot:7241672-Pyramimonas_sp.AAC.1
MADHEDASLTWTPRRRYPVNAAGHDGARAELQLPSSQPVPRTPAVRGGEDSGTGRGWTVRTMPQLYPGGSGLEP